VTRWAAEPLDLLRELRRLKPTVVHFRGHDGRSPGNSPYCFSELRYHGPTERTALGVAENNGMYFRGADGRAQFVSAAALRLTFGAVGRCVKLVVLNTCCDSMHSEKVFPHTDCVIGMHDSSQNGAARNFAIGFYGALGDRESIATAYEQGCAAISLEGTGGPERPHLWVRDGIDAGRIVLAAEHWHSRARNHGRATAPRQDGPDAPGALSAPPGRPWPRGGPSGRSRRR
jgi:uncharacterized protein (DUF779 family)